MLKSRTWFFFLIFTFSVLAAEPIQQEGPAKHLPGGKTGRGYITHKLESAPGGAYLTVEVVQDRTRSKVQLQLAFDGTAYNVGQPNWTLTDGVPNPSGYRTRFQFYLNYADLIKSAISKGVTDAAKRIQPNHTMVVVANFPSGHHWGGTDRSGTFRLPRPQSKQGATPAVTEAPKLPGLGEGPPATSLDVGQVIDSALAEEFAPLRGRGGLEVGGQIRSRVEAEGKFQLTTSDFLTIRKRLFEIAADARQQRSVLGSEWTLKVVDRYMKKTRQGVLIVDAEGFPIPDPMVDTYYDTPTMDAAKNDVAIRYRWTEGNQTGNWNFKPGIGRRSPDGIVYRVEYGVDTVDNRPESIEVFADSNHPLNPFQLLRQIIPGVRPGRFFEPSIRLVDDRYKFALQHKNGLIIEVSLDRVLAERLHKGHEAETTFYQLEMDVEHVATEVDAQAAAMPSAPGEPASPYASLHVPSDVGVNSPTLETQAQTFALATTVIKRLRDDVIGEGWKPGAQKYAFAAAALGAIRPTSASKSVKTLSRGKSCKKWLSQE